MGFVDWPRIRGATVKISSNEWETLLLRGRDVHSQMAISENIRHF